MLKSLARFHGDHNTLPPCSHRHISSGPEVCVSGTCNEICSSRSPVSTAIITRCPLVNTCVWLASLAHVPLVRFVRAAVAVDVVVDLQEAPVTPVEDAARERAEDLDDNENCSPMRVDVPSLNSNSSP